MLTSRIKSQHFNYRNMETRIACLLICLIPLCSNCFTQDRTIKVDGTDIRIHTIGLEKREKGQPLIVFQSGFATPMEHWDTILKGVAELGPLLIYDRPGVGASEPNDISPTIKNVSDMLVSMLQYLALEPPYLLVGHSLGGAYVRGFSRYYPELLAGLVIIDPADFTETQQNRRDYYEVLGWDDERIDQELAALAQKQASRRTEMPKSILAENQVLVDLRKTDFKEIRESPLPNIPVHIITGGRFDMPEMFRSQEYDSETLFRSKMRHRIARWTDVIQSVEKGMLLYSADAGHFVHRDDPTLVISSIRMVLEDYQQMKKKK